MDMPKTEGVLALVVLDDGRGALMGITGIKKVA
jgi:hypothetical protein